VTAQSKRKSFYKWSV